jgi:hypothetical protein
MARRQYDRSEASQLCNAGAALPMNIKIFLIASFVLLFLGVFFWLREHRRFPLPTWRKVLVWLGIISLTISVFTFPRFLSEVQRAEARNEDLQVSTLLPLIRIGFWSAIGAFLIGWLASDKSRVFLLISSLLIWILWTAQARGI